MVGFHIIDIEKHISDTGKSRIGGINHWLFAQEEFGYLISRPFRGENYTNVINGSGVVKGEQKYPKGYQDVLIPELKRRSDFFNKIPALSAIKPDHHNVVTVLVGDKDDPSVAASRSYVGMKSATTKLSGLSSMVEEFPSAVTPEEMYEKLDQWNKDGKVSILMFQLPFGGQAGKTIDTTLLCNRIDISKDGDGLNQMTLGLMSLGADRYYDCCTPGGMIDLTSVYLVRERKVKLRPDGVASFAGLEVLVAGRSAIVGEPLFNLLKCYDATALGSLHTRTGSAGSNDTATQIRVYKDISKRANVIYGCIGFHPYKIHQDGEYLFNVEMLKEGCLIIDASTFFRKDGKRPFGDVGPAARSKAAAFTLEAGGVGPATVTKLVHQGGRGMLYQNADAVRKALEDNKEVVKSVFTKLLADYAGSSEADACGNADLLYQKAVCKGSHPVHAADVLEAIFPAIMIR